MSPDRVIAQARDAIRDRLREAESITETRLGVTRIYRSAHRRCMAQDWIKPEIGFPCDEEGEPDIEEATRLLMLTEELRMSKGTAIKLRLALEEVGIHCDPWLERLDSVSARVRIFRKWQTL